jgi:hypothetical protein
LDLNDPECVSNGKSKITTIAGESSKSTGRTSRATMTSRQSTGETSHEWTLSAADSRASRSVLPGSNEARQMTVTSGRKWSAALTHSGQLGSLARMCLGSSIWHSTKCVLIWKVSATRSGRCVYQLVPLGRIISGSDYGLLPTPRANKFPIATPAIANRQRGNEEEHVASLGKFGMLNPVFSEWRMGYPLNWTDLNQ